MAESLLVPVLAGDECQKFAPLVLDVDQTLLRADLLWETALAYLRLAPWRVLHIFVWLLKGKAVLKAALAREVPLDVALLPVNQDLVDFAMSESRGGRAVHIATAADARLAEAVARRFPFVQRVFASDGVTNLKAGRKAERLQAAFPDGFIYAGDSASDLPIWREAKRMVLAGVSSQTLRAARRLGEPMAILPRAQRGRAVVKLCRPHQWVKNLLVFVPLVLGGATTNPSAVAASVLAFVAMSLVASGTYALNDLHDLENDRRHATKRFRPLASGVLPISWGIGIGVAAIFAGMVTGAGAGAQALSLLALYLTVTLAYSLSLKRVAMVDVVVLAGLFTLRLAIGAASAGVAFSPWLMTFSMFLFLSLSLAKRHTELVRAAKRGLQDPAGRGYCAADEPLVLAAGNGALLASVLVFVIYLTQEAFVAAHLASPRLLWAFPPAIFLLGIRVWLVSGRGELDDDPVAFVLHDRTCLTFVALLGLVTLVSWIGLPALSA